MIRVERISEPLEFDTKCRQRGNQWRKEQEAKSIGFTTASSWRGASRFWTPFNKALCEEFVHRCGYYAMWIHKGTVDHFIAKTKNPDLAFEWRNYRFLGSDLNSKKGDSGDFLDPFEVRDEWFEIELPSLVLKITSELTEPELRKKAEFTLQKLDLAQGHEVIDLRAEWYELHRTGDLTLSGLAKKAPLLARAVEKWRQANRGTLPVYSKQDFVKV
jgi:hypothetical protein